MCTDRVALLLESSMFFVVRRSQLINSIGEAGFLFVLMNLSRMILLEDRIESEREQFGLAFVTSCSAETN